MAPLDENYTLRWRLVRFELYVRIEVLTRGWAAFSFPTKQGSTVPADSVIGWIDADGPNVKPYYITGKTVSLDSENDAVTLRNTSAKRLKFRIIIEFCLSIKTLRTSVNPREITPIYWTYGNITDTKIQYPGEQRGSATIRFADGLE